LLLRYAVKERIKYTGGSRIRRIAGFCLVEILLVVVILATIGTMTGFALFSRAYPRRQLESAGMKLKADLELARQKAMASSSVQKVLFQPGTGAYQCPGLADHDHPERDYQVDLEDRPFETRIASAEFGNDTTLIFDAFGRPDSGGQVTLMAGRYSLTLMVNSETGLAEIQQIR
jgi:type II secretory pathway pseudopilin PulG